MKDRVYIVKDIYRDDIVGITHSKETLKVFLKKRDPEKYEYAKVKDKNHIERIRRLYDELEIVSYGDFALSGLEVQYCQDRLMEVVPGLIYDLTIVLKKLAYVNMTDEEKQDINEGLKIVKDLLYSIDEPPAHLDYIVDETTIFDDYLFSKKYFMEDCL